MEANDVFDVVVVGAGLTGLTAAYYLKKRGLSVCVLEKDSKTGGVIGTHHKNGFAYEVGPNTGVLSNPEVVELFEDLQAYCSIELADVEAKKRLIWKKNRWHAIPNGLLSGIRTPLFSFKDKLRVLGEPWRPKGEDPMESLANMVKRRLGHSILNYAVDPFIGGVYAGDSEKLITKYALPKLYLLEQEYGSFIKGAIQKKKENKDARMQKATKEVFSAQNGLGELVRALEQAVGLDNIIIKAQDVRIVPTNDSSFNTCFVHGSQEHQLNSTKVITTVGAYALEDMMPFLDKADLTPFAEMEYAGVAELAIGFENWQGMDIKSFGGLVPSIENKNILGVLFISSFMKGRAPEGGALITVFVGGSRKPELLQLPDEQLIRIVVEEIKQMLQIKDFKPQLLELIKYDKAIPQYHASSKERLEKIEDIQTRYKGLILAGNMRDGIGMADRIKQARTIAEQI